MAQAAFAQKNNPNYDQKRIRFGFTLAYNSSMFKPTLSTRGLANDTMLTVNPYAMPGFGLGVVSSLKLEEHLDLRFIPSLTFATRQLQYTFTNQAAPVKRNVESAFVEFPFLLKLKSDRLQNFRFYLIGGADYMVDMSSQAKARDDKERVKINKTDYAVQYGVGADFYLPYFKFSTEIKISQGLSNVLVPEQHVFSSSLDKLNGRTIYFSLLFE